ncbi:MAG: hypothetical protein U0326_21370 [Polyangiales bacterium]
MSFRYTSVSGSARNVTLTLDAERRAADVTVAHNRMIAFSLLRRCTVLLAGQAPGALPGTYQTAQVPASLVSVIDAAALGLRVVTFEVDPLVLRAASAVEISLRSPSGDDGVEGDLLAQRVCTADARGGSIALPGLSADAPLRCVVRALPPAGIDAPARVLRDGPAPPSITVGWEDLARDLSCELIVARATSATSERYPYVAATVRARWVPEVFLLLGGEARRVRVTRSSPFEALSFEVKAEWVEAGDGVSDTVQRAGRWRAVTGERAEIDPATEPREEQPS